MTLAIVLAADPAAGRLTEPGRPAGEPLTERLAAQWRRAGADDVRIAAYLDAGRLIVDGTIDEALAA
ncbi:hypothetical protein DRA43_29715 [Micromonospora provocatoris]|nr:hypothetical protein [Micromonospora provocatoris]RBI96596.1 hypothetical protein DRA43_29715 [Micromonospora provocatoris]